MRKRLRKVLAAGIAAVFMEVCPVSAALPPMMPVGEVAQGMSGTGYTVVDESGEIRPFTVDVIGVVKNGKTTTPLIMARASGVVIDSTGGVLQGMSGSPIYVDGRLVGALSAGIKDLSPFTFFITPIEDMIPLWTMPDTKNKSHIATIDIKKAAEEREKRKKGAEEKKEEKASVTSEAAPTTEEKAEPSQTPAEAPKSTEPAETLDPGKTPEGAKAGEEKSLMYLSGFDEAARSYLLHNTPLGKSQSFSFLGADFFAGGQGTNYHASLEPGSMMGVALAYGDFSIGATGTVTAVDDKKILGFGHPFLHKGNVNYFLTDANVVGTVSGVSSGMKLSNIGNIIGRISQDRETGVAGELGVFPDVVPMKVTVKDHGLNREQSYGTRIAYDEDLLPQLSASMAYAAMSKTVDSLGESTAQIHFAIRTDAAESGKAERTNMFYNVTDVGKIAVLELAQAMNLICSNTEQESGIVDVQVEIDVSGGRKTAILVSAVPDKTKVKPGDTVNFTTVIKPYREEKVTLTIPYRIPKNQISGPLNLDIRGGGLIPTGQVLSLQQGADGSFSLTLPEEDKNASTQEKLKKFLSTSRNNEIVISPGAAQGVMSEKAQKKAVREAIAASKAQSKGHTVNLLGTGKDENSRETKFATDYIIENVIHAALQVEK